MAERDAREADTRRRLLEYGDRLFSSRGYGALGTAEIVSSVGSSKGSFYYHFGSKEGFGVAVIEHFFERYLSAASRCLDAAKSKTLDPFWQAWLDASADNPLYWRRNLLLRLCSESEALSLDMTLALQRGKNQLLQLLAQATYPASEDASQHIALSLQVFLGAGLLGLLDGEEGALIHALQWVVSNADNGRKVVPF